VSGTIDKFRSESLSCRVSDLDSKVNNNWAMAKDINLSSGTPNPLLLFLCFTSLMLLRTEAVWLTIPSKGTKCMSEEIQAHVVVLADYYVVADDVKGHQPQTVSVKVIYTCLCWRRVSLLKFLSLICYYL